MGGVDSPEGVSSCNGALAQPIGQAASFSAPDLAGLAIDFGAYGPAGSRPVDGWSKNYALRLVTPPNPGGLGVVILESDVDPEAFDPAPLSPEMLMMHLLADPTKLSCIKDLSAARIKLLADSVEVFVNNMARISASQNERVFESILGQWGIPVSALEERLTGLQQATDDEQEARRLIAKAVDDSLGVKQRSKAKKQTRKAADLRIKERVIEFSKGDEDDMVRAHILWG